MTSAVICADGWRFFLDAGGTFTDCLALPPNQPPRRAKVLSSGRIRSVVLRQVDDQTIAAKLPDGLPAGFFTNWTLSCGFLLMLALTVFTALSAVSGKLSLRRLMGLRA